MRAKANRAFQGSLTVRSQDAANFNAWFAAYLSGKKQEQLVAEKRFRTQYDVAFKAWLATRPFTNPNAPKGPQYMPQYKPPGARSRSGWTQRLTSSTPRASTRARRATSTSA